MAGGFAGGLAQGLQSGFQRLQQEKQFKLQENAQYAKSASSMVSLFKSGDDKMIKNFGGTIAKNMGLTEQGFENLYNSWQMADSQHKQQMINGIVGTIKDPSKRQQAIARLEGLTTEDIAAINRQQVTSSMTPAEPYTLAPGAQRFGGDNEVVAENPRQAASTNIEINNAGETEAQKQFAKLDVENYGKARAAAEDSLKMLTSVDKSLELIEQGIFSGRFADFKLEFGKAVSALGYNKFDDPIANTESYVAESAKRVATIIKAFGSGTGLSDADREFAQQAAAGIKTMSEDAMITILLMERVANANALNKFNEDAAQLEKKHPSRFGSRQVSLPKGFQEQLPAELVGRIGLKTKADGTPLGENEIRLGSRAFMESIETLIPKGTTVYTADGVYRKD